MSEGGQKEGVARPKVIKDMAASVLGRLQKEAVERRVSEAFCRQLFCQEEFLRRLSASPYAPNLILKGGLYLYYRTKFDSRVTMDIDFLVHHVEGAQERILNILQEIFAVETGNDYISFRITRVKPIQAKANYPSVEVTILATIKRVKTYFKIDFGIGDTICPHSEKIELPTQLSGFSEPEINAYSLESTVAEKLDAALHWMDLSSRMKDYYDLFYLANFYSFNGDILRQALQSTFSCRSRQYDAERFSEFIALESNRRMIQQWNLFISRLGVKEIDFTRVMEVLERFLREPYFACCANREMPGQWEHKALQWQT